MCPIFSNFFEILTSIESVLTISIQPSFSPQTRTSAKPHVFPSRMHMVRTPAFNFTSCILNAWKGSGIGMSNTWRVALQFPMKIWLLVMTMHFGESHFTVYKGSREAESSTSILFGPDFTMMWVSLGDTFTNSDSFSFATMCCFCICAPIS